MDLLRQFKQKDMNQRRRRFQSGELALFALTLGVVLFFLLPVFSLILHISPDLFIAALSSRAIIQTILLSFYTGGIATVLVVIIGTPVAYLNTRRNYPGQGFVESVLDLPIVLPPAVAGIALLFTFGRNGLIGSGLDDLGIRVIFTPLAIILAQMFVAGPLYIRQARSAFLSVPSGLEMAGRTLGGSPIQVFLKITLPLARYGLYSGAVLCFARSIGEFGATIMVAGNLPGLTQTMPLAIYSLMQNDMNGAISIALILVILSFIVLVVVRYLTRMEQLC
jgi:molybdate transport system permease protein